MKSSQKRYLPYFCGKYLFLRVKKYFLDLAVRNETQQRSYFTVTARQKRPDWLAAVLAVLAEDDQNQQLMLVLEEKARDHSPS